MMRCDGDWIERTETQAVMASLLAGGTEAYFVGGCVRNSLIGAPVDDIDIATNLLPLDVIARAEAGGFRAIPTGIDHGTITVVANETPFEITTYRKDVETDGRHAVIQFSTSLKEDAERRDFTMNALYADQHGMITDPVGGLVDLEARIVRFIGDPSARIREDYLRILRFFRFHAWYGDPNAGIDPEGLAAVAEHLDGLERLAAERIGKEILKLLGAPDPAQSVASMRATGVLNQILPGSNDKALAPLIHIESDLGIDADPILRLGVLGSEDPCARLRLSKQQCKRLEQISSAVSQGYGATELGYRLKDLAVSAYAASCALLEAIPLPADLALIKRGQEAVFPVRAADLAPLNGAAIGQKLKDLERKWIISGFSLSKTELLG